MLTAVLALGSIMLAGALVVKNRLKNEWVSKSQMVLRYEYDLLPYSDLIECSRLKAELDVTETNISLINLFIMLVVMATAFGVLAVVL